MGGLRQLAKGIIKGVYKVQKGLMFRKWIPQMQKWQSWRRVKWGLWIFLIKQCTLLFHLIAHRTYFSWGERHFICVYKGFYSAVTLRRRWLKQKPALASWSKRGFAIRNHICFVEQKGRRQEFMRYNNKEPECSPLPTPYLFLAFITWSRVLASFSAPVYCLGHCGEGGCFSYFISLSCSSAE